MSPEAFMIGLAVLFLVIGVVCFIAGVAPFGWIMVFCTVLMIFSAGENNKTQEDKIDGVIEYEALNGASNVSDRYKVLDTPTATNNGKVVLFDSETKKIVIRDENSAFAFSK